MFDSRIRLKSLALLCRSLATMLHSGIEIRRAFQLAGTKTGDRRARDAVRGVNDDISRGRDVTAAMRAQGNAFPELMIDMVHVAEQTGSLPEVLRALSEHYDNLVRLRKDFIWSISRPVLQFVLAVLIIAFVIYILGMIQESRPNAPDTLGLGLRGAGGAAIWLLMTFGSVAVAIAAYAIIARSLAGRQAVHSLMLRIPVIGNCMRSFALARFSWAFALTQQAGMSIEPSLKSSLRATGNGAYQAAAPKVWYFVREGETLSDALAETRLFPSDFLEMVHVAEHSGTVPEALERLSPQFEADARRSLQALASTLGWLIWALVAGFIVFLIFSIAMRYVGMINENLPQ